MTTSSERSAGNKPGTNTKPSCALCIILVLLALHPACVVEAEFDCTSEPDPIAMCADVHFDEAAPNAHWLCASSECPFKIQFKDGCTELSFLEAQNQSAEQDCVVAFSSGDPGDESNSAQTTDTPDDDAGAVSWTESITTIDTAATSTTTGWDTESTENDGGGSEATSSTTTGTDSNQTSSDTDSVGATSDGGETSEGTSTSDETGDGSQSSDDTDSSEESSQETGDSDICSDGWQCVASPPPGWIGPTTIWQDDAGIPAPPCGTLYPDREEIAHSVLDEGRFECTCGCEPSGALCEDADVWKYIDPNGSDLCEDATEKIYELGHNECQNFERGDFWMEEYLVLHQLALTGGTCTPRSTSEIDTPTWERQTLMCNYDGPVEPRDCTAGNSCIPPIPSEFNSSICIHAQGDLQCPIGLPYQNRSVHYSNLLDERACTPCQCGALEGECNGEIVARSGTCANPGQEHARMRPEFCDWYIWTNDYNVTFESSVDVDCPTIGGNHSGSVRVLGATTVCCL